MDSYILPLLVVPESFCPSISWNLNYVVSTIPLKYEVNSNPSGTAVELPCSASSAQDLQAGTSPWSYLLSSCDGVGMTLYKPIPQLYVSVWLQKGESTAFRFCHTAKAQPPAPRTVICHGTKQSLWADHSSMSDTEILHRNVTLVPSAAISKPGNLTKLQIYTLQVLPWSRAAAAAEWPGLGLAVRLGDCRFSLPLTARSATWAKGIVLGSFAAANFQSWGSRQHRSSVTHFAVTCHVLQGKPWRHFIKGTCWVSQSLLQLPSINTSKPASHTEIIASSYRREVCLALPELITKLWGWSQAAATGHHSTAVELARREAAAPLSHRSIHLHLPKCLYSPYQIILSTFCCQDPLGHP